MKIKRAICICSLLIVSSFILIACRNVNENIISNDKKNIIAATEGNINDNQDIKSFILKFLKAIHSEDLELFKEIIDKDGIYSITYFIDGRDRNVVLHLNKDEIRDDLVLANSEKMGIGLSSMYYSDLVNEIESIPIQSSKLLSDISFNVDWHDTDESVIEKRIEDIIKTCQKINLTNNEYIPQVFVLKDNIYAFAYSSGILEPEPEFTGYWTIFEKIDSEYYLRAVIDLQ
ncbi:hypothetical protein [Lutispora sp.]|uniref:hypothetical protein n=1 Tax=Lutispora sp. TaxID=2828727 RepID=UPI002B212D4E|nr:hypothetical protein [Lutispora sp.]MEA4964093.1 hypothetical protein [Lutispora sp.]